MKHTHLFLLAICAWFAFATPQASATVSTADINWSEFLSQHDMYWDKITIDYYGGAIMGNGLLGTNLYKASADTYRLDVGRTDVTEGRGQMPLYKAESHLYNEARLPIGYFTLATKGTVSKETMRLSLYDATTKGQLTTDKGVLDFKTYVHADKNYIIFESEASKDERDYTWSFVPLTAISPRYVNNSGDKDAQTNYNANPNPAVKSQTDGDYNLSIQNLVCGKTYVVAWKEVKAGNQRRIIATVSQEATEKQAIAVAKRTIAEGFATKQALLEASHTDWWHNYYPASFISLGDTKMESFYWAQIYKFACASRPGKPIADLQGPWAVQKTPWPAVWLNLNTQLTYSWQYAANRSDMTLPLWQAFKDNRENLIKNVTEIAEQSAWTDAMVMSRSSGYNFYRPLKPSLVSVNQYEVGNLTWLLYYYWQYCVYNNKQGELKTDFFDLLKHAINYYVHIRTKSGNIYHLPATSSPEYGTSPVDCNYDLSVLRWGLQTLLAIDNKYGLNDANKAVYQDFLDNLTDYPVDDVSGLNLGQDTPFTASHRHYSHLLMIYPLYTVNWEQTENQDVITRSVNNWQSLTGQLQGYSFTGSAAMYASMGNGDLALTRLNSLLGRYIQKNTLYKESGPVFETPMAAVASIHDLYLQSWGGKIRVFPAVPTAWKQASFIDLRTEGAFLISATRDNGQTVFIQVKSEAGGLCRLQTNIAGKIRAQTLDGKEVPFTVLDAEKGLIEIDTQAGDVLQITSYTAAAKLPMPLAHPASETNSYGDNR
ncbi:hypothetical protein AGMMS49525_07790 [Bacteroidia bacterium]|nr:hypothetical protein AGMMS49525_07790 [Bacteroidia bacterium]